MLRGSRCAAVSLYDIDDDDRLTCYYAYSWFEICHTIFDLLEETLSLHDVVLEEETTRTGGSHTIDGVNTSTYHCKRHR